MMQCRDSMSFCFFKQKKGDEMRISDWSSDVCSSDLVERAVAEARPAAVAAVRVLERVQPRVERERVESGAHGRGGIEEIVAVEADCARSEIGRASCRESGCQSV